MVSQKIIIYFREKIKLKGMQLVDHFSCKGFNTHGPLKLAGGTNKGYPDVHDLFLTEIFANNLLSRL